MCQKPIEKRGWKYFIDLEYLDLLPFFVRDKNISLTRFSCRFEFLCTMHRQVGNKKGK